MPVIEKDNFIERITEDNESDSEPNERVIKEFNQNKPYGSKNFFRLPLVQQYTFIDYRVNIEQLVVFNPTALVIHIGLGSDCDATRFDLLVNANKLAIFPVMNCIRYSFYLVAFTTQVVNPFAIAYTDGCYAPGIYSI